MESNKHKREENGVGPPKRSRDPAASLPTHPSHYPGAFPFYRLPSEVGRFSLDGERGYHGDGRGLRYYKAVGDGAAPGWDLKDGYEGRYVRRDEEEKEGLLHLLTWAKENRGLLGGGGKRPVDRDFVTWRGHLTKVLCSPYETREGWVLAVTLFRGTLYLSERETAAARRKREECGPEHRLFMYMGYKFEQYMCAASPDSSPSPRGVVNTNEGFCSVVLARLSSHSLLCSGEVDCTDTSDPSALPPSCYVELKTSGEMRSSHQQRSFNRYKLLKWWSQSFLLGIPLIVAGFRSPEGTVASVREYRTAEIPRLIRSEKHSWDPAVCMNFCDAFLSYVRRTVTRDDPGLVHLFSWEPNSDVTFSVHTDPDLVILPAWYVAAMSQ